MRRLLTCFFAPAPLPLVPATGPGFFFERLRVEGVASEVDERALRLARFVVVDLPEVFRRISLIALRTMPEINVSTMPAMLILFTLRQSGALVCSARACRAPPILPFSA